MKPLRSFLTLIFGLGLAAVLFVVFGSRSAQADPGTLFAKPDGTGTACTQANPCALPKALSQAGDGDTIYLAAGTYTGTGNAVIIITRSVTLYGG